MDKQHMVYTLNRMLFSLENEGVSGTCYNISEPWKHDAKWHKPVTTRTHVGSTPIRYPEYENS